MIYFYMEVLLRKNVCFHGGFYLAGQVQREHALCTYLKQYFLKKSCRQAQNILQGGLKYMPGRHNEFIEMTVKTTDFTEIEIG